MVYAVIIIILSAADQLIKWLINSKLGPLDSITVIEGFFYIIVRQNSGAAWSFLAKPAWGIYVLTVISIIMTGFLIYLLHQIKHKIIRFSLTLIIAGSLGNLVDRIRLGAVTDYLDFHFGNYVFPTFNLADALIVVGAGLLCLLLITRPQYADAFLAGGRSSKTVAKEQDNEADHPA